MATKAFTKTKFIAISTLLWAGLVMVVQAQQEGPLTSNSVQAYSRHNAADDQALSAGSFIRRSDGSSCTSGFPVMENSSQMLAYTTAGHCAGDDQDLVRITDAKGSYLGHLLAYRWGFVEFMGFGVSWPQETDAALVVDYVGEENTQPVPYIYVGDSTSVVRQYIHDYRDPLLGEAVCFGGAVTGENCRGVVTRVDVSKVVYDTAGVGMLLQGLIEVQSWDGSVLAQPGDSGGPVYVKESIGLNEVITGIGAIEGGIGAGSSTTAYFLPVSRIVPTGWSLVRADCSRSWFVYSCE